MIPNYLNFKGKRYYLFNCKYQNRALGIKFFEYHKHGCTRLVLCIGIFVIKIANHSFEHHHFLKGLAANWSERKYTQMFKGVKGSDYYSKISPTLFSSWFGLFSIQLRCLPHREHLTDEEMEYFKNQCGTDIKKENFGHLPDGSNRMVCLDYGD